MNLRDPKAWLSAVVAALGMAATSGFTWAKATEQVAVNVKRIEKLEATSKEDHDRIIRVEEILKSTKEIVERIERKLDR
jgi:hypothetical protein